MQSYKTHLTVKELVELYLVKHIEDRKGKDGKIISNSRKNKGQIEVRRMLKADAVRVLGELMAREVTRKDAIELVRELSVAYEFAIGLGTLMIILLTPLYWRN